MSKQIKICKTCGLEKEICITGSSIGNCKECIILKRKQYDKEYYLKIKNGTSISKNIIQEASNDYLICNKCGIEKNVNDFTLNKQTKTGYCNRCKDCNNLYARKFRLNKSIESGYIYIITNKAWPEYVKLGRTKILDRRLKTYQTGSPFRDYEMYYNNYTDKLLVIENYFNENFENMFEWFKVSKDDAVNIIEKLI